MDPKGPEPLSEVLSRLFAARGWGRQQDRLRLERAWAEGFKDSAELVFLLSQTLDADRRERLEIGVSAKMFRLGCAPVVNLFAQTAEPILLDQTRYDRQ